MSTSLRRARRTTSQNTSFGTFWFALLLPCVAWTFAGTASASAHPQEAVDADLLAAERSAALAAVDGLTASAIAADAPQFDAYGNKVEQAAVKQSGPQSPNLIGAGTYVFAALAGVALEDMSSGTSLLVAADLDDQPSAIAPIGFDFWYDGVRQNLFSVNANGLMRLGVANITNVFTNSMVSTTNNPHIAPYWDDIWVGSNGRVHYKVVGSSPNRKLVVEWNNEQIPRVAAATAGAGTFQAWLFESTGVIEFVYGTGVAVNSANSGYTIGLGTSATSFAAVTTATNTVSYVAANDTQTGAIPSGTAYTFTPNAPAAPGALSFTAVGLNTMTLNWADTNANEFGYAIYRSVDGVNYEFVRQTALDVTSSAETGLASNTTWSWRVVAVTEGGVSTASSGSQATTTGTLSGTRTVGPTGNYLTLGAAVTDIITNGLAGNLVLELQAAYVSGVETFPLVINALGSPSNTITIRPETGATALSITSADTTATIDLNGATNVTIDGRAGGAGASQLTLANTATAGLAVRLINGASRNTIAFASIQGVNTATTGGVVLFGTSTGVTGNNRNTIDTCDVTNGATTPVNGITSIGTATTSLLNTGNTISNNNISNFFGATVATNGILVTVNTNLSNTGWTISNNRIFQTAARTYTAANTHRGMLINGGNDYTVSGNMVGFANSGGTGTYTMTGAGATNFIAMQVVAGSGVNGIQGNTVAGISLSTASGGLSGIALTGGAADIGTVSANTIGSVTGTGSLTVGNTASGAFILGINASGATLGNVNVSNNTVGALTTTGTPVTANSSINAMQLLGGALTATNNLVGSNSTANSIQITTTGTSGTGQQVIGMFTGAAMPATISGNTIANLSNAGTGTAHVTRGMQFQIPTFTAGGSAGFATIQSNTIHDISGAHANTTVAGGGTAVQGIIHTGLAPHGASVTQNTIHTILATNAAAVSTTVSGIGYSNPTNGTVTRNRIYDLRNASTGVSATAPPMALGILIRAALAPGATFANNMISLGDSQTTNTQFVGMMNSFNASTLTIAYNSVHIAGTAGAGALPSYGFLRGDNSAGSVIATPVNIKNNILNNTRTGGTGKHYAIGNVNTVPATGWGAGASDFNVLNSPVAGTVGIWGLAADQTFASWKVASAGDASSQSGVSVLFTTPATADLHLNFGLTPTSLESGGTAVVGLTTDFDNQTRPGPPGSVNGGAIAPDIGADEFDGVPLDITAPSISYTAFANTTLTLNRTLNATITDSGGVAGGANAPRIYYRKNAGAYFSNQCGAPTGNVYPCTIDYSLVGGAVTGDVIDYFVVAQDTTGNVGANPGGGFSATDVNTVTTPPTVPSTYTIVAGTSGTRTVCAAGCDFATLTGAGGVFAGLNAAIFTGNVNIEITGDLVAGEDGSVALNPLNEEPSGSNFTLGFYPTGVAPRLITSTTAPTGGFIRLNGADRVTIDGSIGGTGTDRSLTITDTNTGIASAAIWLQSNGSDGATNNVIKNLNVVGTTVTATAATLFGIGSGGPAVSLTSFATGNHNNTFQNNSVSKTQIGIYSAGASTAVKNTGTVITQNGMNSASPNNVTTGGVLVRFEDGIQITRNDIGNLVKHDGATGTTGTVFGIALGVVPFNTTTVFTGNEVVNAQVTRNRIGPLTQLHATGFSGFGIVVGSAASGTTLVANNMISEARAASTANDFAGGIIAGGGAGSTTRIYANSVSMTGTRGAASFPSYGLAIAAGDPIVDVQDNIFFNTQTSSSTAKMYAIANGSTTFTNMTSHHNDLFVGVGASFFVGQTGGLGTSGTDRATLTDWQTATSQDLTGSLSVDPLFVSTSDLHITALSPMIAAGSALASVTVDFDGDPRPASLPDIGADEIVAAADLSITKDDGVTSVNAGGSTTYTIIASNAGPTAATGATVTDNFPVEITSCSTTCVPSPGAACNTGPFPGNINDTVTIPIGENVTYTAVCNIGLAATGNLVNTATVTVPGGMTDPNSANNSATDTDTILGVATADLSITKTDGASSETPGTPVTYTIVAANAGPNAVTGATVADTFPASLTGCSTSCVGTLGGTCTAGPVLGNINDSVNLPVGASVTYTSTCNIAASASGSLSNTATITGPVAPPDPNAANNSATDTDTLIRDADVSITKTDGSPTELVGTPVTYTIVATNAAGPSTAAVTVTDNFVAALSGCSTTCVGSVGGLCTPGPVSGNFSDVALLPVGGSVTYTATCNISATTYGSLSNTATVAATGSGTDPNGANNSATDTDLLNAIFPDGFETGDTSQWSNTVPLWFGEYARVPVEEGATEASFAYDLSSVRSGRVLEPAAIVSLTDANGRLLARVEARRIQPGAALELRLEVGGVAGEWRAVAEVDVQVMRLQWAAGHSNSWGYVSVTLDGVLVLWKDGFTPASAPADLRLLRDRTEASQ